jgi:glycosyltransferase involved in cell wall biosynthesis
MTGLGLEVNNKKMQNSKTKILVVCMLDSIHSARWLTMFAAEDFEFILFPSTPSRRVHPKIAELVSNSKNQNAKFTLSKKISLFAIPIWAFGILTNLLFPAFILKRIAIKNKVSKIHAIELNHAGYLVRKTYEIGLPKEIQIISTNWGSDIYWFQRFPKHEKKLKKLMQISDIYSAECTRDFDLATKFGFLGEFKSVVPNSGGFAIDEIQKSQVIPSSRNSIVIKGYESFVGRASIALAGVKDVAELLKDYTIYIYSANKKTKRMAEKFRKDFGLNFVIFPKKSLTHEQVLDLFRQSRIYLGVSLSDGISTSLLEAIVCGTFPIQTNTSCANEWVTDGVNGLIIHANQLSVSDALSAALTQDVLVDEAAKINHEIAKSRLELSAINNKLSNFYN